MKNEEWRGKATQSDIQATLERVDSQKTGSSRGLVPADSEAVWGCFSMVFFA
jgi:hypothetical protein